MEDIIKRLEELEKWKEAAQCSACQGRGYFLDGFKEFCCCNCNGHGLSIQGRI